MSKIHIFELKATGNSVNPTAMADNDMVFLWVTAAETKPEPNIPIKYPKDINRKSNPASLWVRLRSASIAGIKGAKMIRAVKLTKKVDAKKSKVGS